MAGPLFRSWRAMRRASWMTKDAGSPVASTQGNEKRYMTESMEVSERAGANHGMTDGDEVGHLRELILERLISTTGKDQTSAGQRDWFIATALVVRDRIIRPWIASKKANYEEDRRRVYYLSLEFLIGRLLMDALNNLGLTSQIREALAGLDVDLDKLSEMEPDA